MPWALTQKVTDTWISSITPKTGSDNQQITIEYKENTDNMQRVAVLTLAATDVGATETVSINLTQAGQVSVARQLSANKTNIPVNAAAGEGYLQYHCQCALGNHPKSYGYLDYFHFAQNGKR